MTPFRRRLLAQKHGSSETDHIVYGPADFNIGASETGKWISALSPLRGVVGEKVRIEFDYEYSITNPSAEQKFYVRTHSKTGITDNSYYYFEETVTETASDSGHFSQTWTTVNDSTSMRSFAGKTLTNEGTFKISNFTIYEVY